MPTATLPDAPARLHAGGLPDPLAGIAACIGAELSGVDGRFDRELVGDLPAVNRLVKHVGRFRGKMLRPMLTLLCGKAVNPRPTERQRDDLVTLATVVEMVHMATLVHDDVLDEAELRRKGATINHLKGNEAAVLLGDYLISHSYHLCSSLQSQAAARAVAAATNRVCEGELLQIEHRHDLALDEATYLEIVGRKTGALTAVCGRLGATYAGGTGEQIDALERYCLLVGIAFQIQDDLLDLLGEQRQVGKTLGIDVAKGKLTLPLIHFLQSAPPEHRALLKSLLSTPDDGDRLERVRNLVLPSGSVEYARRRADEIVGEARACLTGLPGVEAAGILDAMAEFVVRRVA